MRMAVCGVDHDEVDAGGDQLFGARVTLVADGRGRGHAQPPLLVLARMGIGDRLLDILDGDQADAAVLAVDDEQLLDPVLMQQLLGLFLTHPFAHRDEFVLGHQLRDALARVGGKAHVAIGQDADQPARAVAGALHHRDAGNPMFLHQIERLLQRRVGLDGERVHHHARLEFLDLTNLRRLHLGLHVAMEHADPAGLRHGDGHGGLGHGVHGGGDDRDIDGDRLGDAGADVDIGRHDVRQGGLDQHVVERERLARASTISVGHRQSPGRHGSDIGPAATAGNESASPCGVGAGG